MLALRTESDKPLYQQIVDGLRHEITAGALPAETKLPSSRQLAQDLAVSRITVENAYAELIADGIIEARGGSGTFVLPAWPSRVAEPGFEDVAALPVWQQELKRCINPERERMLTQILRGPLIEGVIPFAWGGADPRQVPTTEFRRSLTRVLDRDGAAAFGAEGAAGYLPLRENVTSYLQKLGLDVCPDDILITAGSQQVIMMTAMTLIRPGDNVITEAPTWSGALDAFVAHGAHVTGIPVDGDGMRVDLLEAAIARDKPRLIFSIPTFHNPTGSVMSATRRRALVSLAATHGIPILEDDPMRELRFGDPIPPPLAAFDQSGNVIYSTSFTKSLIPALRLGYVVARGPMREWLTSLKRTSDLFSSTLMQRALADYIEAGAIQRHWRRVSRLYRRRHETMVAALKRHFPPGVSWSGVAGGMLIWIGVPPGVSVAELYERALQSGVSFVAGAAFFPEPADQPFLRLNFGAIEEAEIERGIAILGRLLHEEIAIRGLAQGSSP